MQIIVSIDRPTSNDPNAQTRWQKTVDTCESLARQKGVASNTALGLGVWLLPSESGLPFLGIVIAQAEEGKYPYRLIVVDERFSWKCGPLGFGSANVFGGGGKK